MNRILILDYGSQFTQLIARRVREARVYCEIHPAARGTDFAFVTQFDPKGIILSGGPNSVFDPGAPTADPQILARDVPVLGICYGMQLVAQLAGGKVKPSRQREYGRAEVTIREATGLFAGFEPQSCITVWASHGDKIDEPPPHYRVTASSANAPVAAMQHESRPIYGVLFHPEVAHTPRGGEILHNFLFEICRCTPDWTPGHFIEHEVQRIQALVGPAQLHHCHFKCTVYYTETIQSSYPFSFKCTRRRTEVVYIDRDHLHQCVPSPETRQSVTRDLTTRP